MIQYFNDYYYTCYGFGHKANQCRSRMNGRNVVQNNVVCHNCSRPQHIAKFCRSKNTRKDNSVKRDEPIKKIDPKETKKEMNKIWRNKEETNDKGESIPPSSADVSSRH